MTYWVYIDGIGEYRWRLRTGNNEIIADSGEGYKNSNDCEAAIDLVKATQAAPIRYES